LLAAKAARMRCIVVPDAEQAEDPRFAIAEVKLRSLEALTAEALRG
jgi:sugar-phosphatase